jgi:acetylglutamate kinase
VKNTLLSIVHIQHNFGYKKVMNTENLEIEKSSTAPLVIKMGGSTLSAVDTTFDDLAYVQKLGAFPVVVHGGGNLISEWVKRAGFESKFVRGLRVTDHFTLQNAVAVLAGLVNKQLVASLTFAGARAVGLSGVDASLFQSEILDSELGFVGGIPKVDTYILDQIISSGIIPVIAPIALKIPIEGMDNQGGLNILNVNGDSSSGALAASLHARQLIFLTDVEGVLDIDGRVIKIMTEEDVKELLDNGIASGGMIPKLEAAIYALPYVEKVNIIDGRKPNAIIHCYEGNDTGTTITRSL